MTYCFAKIIYSPYPKFLPSLSEIGGLSCIISCLVFSLTHSQSKTKPGLQFLAPLFLQTRISANRGLHSCISKLCNDLYLLQVVKSQCEQSMQTIPPGLQRTIRTQLVPNLLNKKKGRSAELQFSAKVSLTARVAKCKLVSP